MPDVTASYETFLDYVAFFCEFSHIVNNHTEPSINNHITISEVFYLHQTFTDYVSDQCTYFGISTCQMWLQVMEGYLI